MKRLLSLIILLSMFVGIFTVPANAKSSSKTKTLIMYLEGEGRGVEVTCSVPYYSKWKVSERAGYGNYAEFLTSNGEPIIVNVMNSNDSSDAKKLCKYLSKKKYKKQLYAYLCEGFSINEELADNYFTLKKDGNGKYMLIINLGDEYGVIRALDGSHVFLYFTEVTEKTVSKSLQKKLISYTKQVKFEEKTAGIDEHDPEVEFDILDVELDPDKIIFESVYSNMAWGYQKQAVFVLGDGRVYKYDFAENPGKIDISKDENALEYLKGTVADATLDKDYLMKMYSCAVRVDPNAEYTTKHEMCDYGQVSLYFYAEDGTKVKCSSYGDVRYIYDDDYAKMVESLWDRWYLYCEEVD